MMNHFLMLWGSMVAIHILLDYPLQGDFMAKAKNHNDGIPFVPWALVLSSHAFVHAAAVAFMTGQWRLGALEFVLHFYTDFFKNENNFGMGLGTAFAFDQLVHILCKAAWAAICVFLVWKA